MTHSTRISLLSSEPLTLLFDRAFSVSTAELPSEQRSDLDEALQTFLQENAALDTQDDSAGLLIGRVVVNLSNVLWESLQAMSVIVVSHMRAEPVWWNAATLLATLRQLAQSFTRLDPRSGEVCVYRASLSITPHHPMSEFPPVPDVQTLMRHMTCLTLVPSQPPHSVINCRYRSDDKCQMTSASAKSILDKLTAMGVFRKS